MGQWKRTLIAVLNNPTCRLRTIATSPRTYAGYVLNNRRRCLCLAAIEEVDSGEVPMAPPQPIVAPVHKCNDSRFEAFVRSIPRAEALSFSYQFLVETDRHFAALARTHQRICLAHCVERESMCDQVGWMQVPAD